MPAEWALPWSNALLHQRIKERAIEPGCGSGMRRGSSTCSPMSLYLNVFCPDFPDVAPTDPAASFIAENALNDLAHFTCDRDTIFLDKPGGVGRTAFDVVDLDRQRHVVLDTSLWNGSTVSLSSNPDGLLQSLFMQVFGFRTTICIVLKQANGMYNLENCGEISS